MKGLGPQDIWNGPGFGVTLKLARLLRRFGRAGRWEEVREAERRLQALTTFAMGDVAVRFDYVRGMSQYGMSNYARIFLDGPLALLVYYKGKHILTIGFSIRSGRRLFVQQVQSPRRKGNRGLYKLPSNHLEFALDLLRQYFSDYTSYVVEGRSVVKRNARLYYHALKRAKKFGDEKDEEEVEAKLAHLSEHEARIVSFYRNAGKYRLVGVWRKRCNGLWHYRVKF